MKCQPASFSHAGWLHRRMPGGGPKEWQAFWCVLRSSSISYYEDEACQVPVDKLKLRADTELILVSLAEGYDDSSRRAIERLRDEHPCSFALCYDCEVDGEVEQRDQQACATVFHDALDLETLASWQEEIERTLQRIISAQSALDNQCFIDDLSDYEDESSVKRSSLDGTMESDWTQIAGLRSRKSTGSIHKGSCASQYEIDDMSDYENDEVARSSSLTSWQRMDWTQITVVRLRKSDPNVLAEQVADPEDSKARSELPDEQLPAPPDVKLQEAY